ncbi:MAG: hypothetical protein ACK4WH_04085 [Phycisphaerales bacterium]
MILRAFSLLAVGGLAASAFASSFPGNPADMYLTSDSANEVYQYERVAPWNYVPGTYAGTAKPQVFSNVGQIGSVGLYLGCVAGANQDFYLGGFGALTVIDSNTGVYLNTIPGTRIGPATAPNGNIVVGGNTGTEEYTPAGVFVRTVHSAGNGYNLHAFDGDRLYTSNWVGGFGFAIKQHSFTTGLSAGPDIPCPFEPQKLAIGPDGALYAANLYQATSALPAGVYRYSGSGWTLFADGEVNTGTGPHGFAWDPISLDLYLAFQTGEIERYNGITGAHLNQIDIIPTKLTDLLFKQVIPSPGAASLLALGGLLVARRRRNA